MSETGWWLITKDHALTLPWLADFAICRYTSKSGAVYAIVLKWPSTGTLTLGSYSGTAQTSVSMLGECLGEREVASENKARGKDENWYLENSLWRKTQVNDRRLKKRGDESTGREKCLWDWSCPGSSFPKMFLDMCLRTSGDRADFPRIVADPISVQTPPPPPFAKWGAAYVVTAEGIDPKSETLETWDPDSLRVLKGEAQACALIIWETQVDVHENGVTQRGGVRGVCQRLWKAPSLEHIVDYWLPSHSSLDGQDCAPCMRWEATDPEAVWLFSPCVPTSPQPMDQPSRFLSQM